MKNSEWLILEYLHHRNPHERYAHHWLVFSGSHMNPWPPNCPCTRCAECVRVRVVSWILPVDFRIDAEYANRPAPKLTAMTCKKKHELGYFFIIINEHINYIKYEVFAGSRKWWLRIHLVDFFMDLCGYVAFFHNSPFQIRIIMSFLMPIRLKNSWKLIRKQLSEGCILARWRMPLPLFDSSLMSQQNWSAMIVIHWSILRKWNNWMYKIIKYWNLLFFRKVKLVAIKIFHQ